MTNKSEVSVERGKEICDHCGRERWHHQGNMSLCPVAAFSFRAKPAARPTQPPVMDVERSKTMNDAQIKHMANRFLNWRLPEHFSPDAGIKFTPSFPEEPLRSQQWPVGTNLLSADQAEAMVRHMIEQLP